jgi:hypothetical protein
MRDRGINPVQLERKREKERQLKKARAQKLDRLSKVDTGHIERKIQRLEREQQDEELTPHQARQLQKLRSELEEIRRAKTKTGGEDENTLDYERVHERRYNPYFGKKSIYYDPLLNPRGDPPPAYPFAERKFDDDGDEDDSGYETSESVSAIPMPRFAPRQEAEIDIKYPKPKVSARTTYEAAPELRNLTKESSSFVPAALLRKKRKIDPTPDIAPDKEEPYNAPSDIKPRSVVIEDIDDDDEDW